MRRIGCGLLCLLLVGCNDIFATTTTAQDLALSTSYARGRLSKGANLKISADSECVVLARKNVQRR